MFELDKTLAKDTVALGSLPLSELLLMNDSNYPWLILVPRVEGMTELIHLFWEDQTTLLAEINLLSRVLRQQFDAEKLNIATLGNVVSQLHCHCVARQRNDAAWPAPVWGKVPVVRYPDDALEKTARGIIKAIDEDRGLAFASRPSYS